MEAKQPNGLTAVEVERRLVRHYLQTDGAAGAGPLTYIDASPAAIREALDCFDGDAAIKALADGCGGADSMAGVLANGWHASWPDPHVPGYFRFLVLTCAVVAMADDNEVSRDFGTNLQRLYKTERGFGLRQSLPGLWWSLVAWCATARSAGASIRQVELPPPGIGVHLGLTNAVSFPSWRDLAALRLWFERNPRAAKDITKPTEAAVRLCAAIVQGSRFSDQLIEAAEDFHRLYTKRASLLHLHRFWDAVCRALERKRAPLDAASARVRIELQLAPVAAEIGLTVDMLDQSGAEDKSWEPIRGTVEEVVATMVARKSERTDVSDARARFATGALVFAQERFGVWAASSQAPSSEGDWLFLLSYVRATKASAFAPMPRVRLSDSWYLLGPVQTSAARRLHQALGLSDDAQADEESAPLTLESGVRTLHGWLGRMSVLPTVHRAGTGRVTLRPKGGDAEGPLLVPAGATLRIQSDIPLDGIYRLSLEDVSPSGTRLAVERKVRFVADAPEHFLLAAPSATWRDEPECLLKEMGRHKRPASAIAPVGIPVPDTDSPSRMDDFLEAVYAGGRCGWGEIGLVKLVEVLLPGPSPWDVLRSLQEAGWLCRMVSVRWNASNWRLVRPCLLDLGAHGRAVVLTGSCPRVVRNRFVSTARSLGATVLLSHGVGPNSVVTLVASGVDPLALSSELGWPLELPLSSREIRAPACWPTGKEDHRQHQWCQEWNWRSGTFSGERSDIEDPVRLTRWVRAEHDRIDIFTVQVAGKTTISTTSRIVAISEAYRLAKRPLFTAEGGRLTRSARQGHLPLHLARASHLASSCAPGVVRTLSGWGYSYATDPYVTASVEKCLGRPFLHNPNGAPDAPRAERRASSLVGMSRHRGSPFRYPLQATRWK